jgi:predicted solute-binding protein
VQDENVVAEAPLSFTGKRSVYAASLPLRKGGRQVLRVVAMDPANANFGMVEREIVVAR